MPIPITPKQFVQEYFIRSIAICFSGGKDSLATTHYVLSELADVDVEKHVIFVDTTVMVPIAIEFVKEVCSTYGWPLTILKPNPDFWALAPKWGTPSIHRRWCCYALKLKPIFDFVKKMPPQRASITGMRKDESARRQKLDITQVRLDKRRGMHAWAYHPLLYWSEKDVNQYLKDHGLPTPPHYRLGIKETCMCGAFTSKKSLEVVRALYPDFYKRFVELEENFLKGTAFFIDHKKVKAKDLWDQQTLG